MPVISTSTRGRPFLAWMTVFLCCLGLVESFFATPTGTPPLKAFSHGFAVTLNAPRRQRRANIWNMRLKGAIHDESGSSESRRTNEIVVSSEINLPFSAETAFNAFSDMSRQTSWSPWLQSVEYMDDSLNTTFWKMNYLGVSTSWVSMCTYEDRPNTICWSSIQGLRNRGRVDFIPSHGNTLTRMKMSMAFQVPGLIARMFTSNGKISRMVEKRMIMPTIESFCLDVLRNDCSKGISASSPDPDLLVATR